MTRPPSLSQPLSWLLALLLAPAAGHAAEIHALVIGINDYRYPTETLPVLHGAVADAQDVAAAIRQLGASDVRVLLNAKAERAEIFKQWDAMVARAKPGDTVFLSFAGHGGQEPERVPGSGIDGKVQTTLLAGFREDPPHNLQRIFDYEWKQRIHAVPELNVIGLFDSCHSGSATRQATGGILTSRNGVYGDIDPDQDLVPLITTDIRELPEVAPNETYIGATLDGQLAYEIQIGEQTRGVASYYFARALRGHADADRDGQLSRGELARYMVENVRSKSSTRQTASVDYPSTAAPDSLLLVVPASKNAIDDEAVVDFAISGMPADRQAELVAGMASGKLVAQDAAQLLWRFDRQDVVNRLSADIVATEIGDAGQFAAVVEKWSTYARIQQLTETGALQLRFDSGDLLYRQGQFVTARVERPDGHQHLILMNLAGNGELQFIVSGRDYEIEDIPVTGPFGADHLIAISSADEPSALVEQLKGLHRSLDSDQLYRLLRDQDADLRLGHLAFYTAP